MYRRNEKRSKWECGSTMLNRRIRIIGNCFIAFGTFVHIYVFDSGRRPTAGRKAYGKIVTAMGR